MPDIAMCKGGNCPMRDHCYRFRAVPNDRRQAYFAQPPLMGVQCMEFIPITGYSSDQLQTPEEPPPPAPPLAFQLRRAAERIDRMTNAPAATVAVNVATLWAWAQLFNEAADALDK